MTENHVAANVALSVLALGGISHRSEQPTSFGLQTTDGHALITSKQKPQHYRQNDSSRRESRAKLLSTIFLSRRDPKIEAGLTRWDLVFMVISLATLAASIAGVVLYDKGRCDGEKHMFGVGFVLSVSATLVLIGMKFLFRKLPYIIYQYLIFGDLSLYLTDVPLTNEWVITIHFVVSASVFCLLATGLFISVNINQDSTCHSIGCCNVIAAIVSMIHGTVAVIYGLLIIATALSFTFIAFAGYFLQ